VLLEGISEYRELGAGTQREVVEGVRLHRVPLLLFSISSNVGLDTHIPVSDQTWVLE
jgi:hypothetical protein